MIRVSFRSEDLSAFSSSVFTDRYVKLSIPSEPGSPEARLYTDFLPPRDWALPPA